MIERQPVIGAVRAHQAQPGIGLQFNFSDFADVQLGARAAIGDQHFSDA